MTPPTLDASVRSRNPAVVRANRWLYRLARSWLLVFSLGYGLYVALPFLAPALMALGLELPARVIYTVYSFLCHQLPQRSFFLFGPRLTYALPAIQAAGGDAGSLAALRQFTGTAGMGWKVAWSDRMVAMYTSVLLFAWAWYPLRRRLAPLGWPAVFLLLLPMAVDGFSHLFSDLAGMGQGFRDSNQWLAALTNGAFAPAFYAGDAWGSFNSLMRLVSGVLFGLAVVGRGFPIIDEYFVDLRERIRAKFARAGIPL